MGVVFALLICSLADAQEKAAPPAKVPVQQQTPAQEKAAAPGNPPAQEKPPAPEKVIIPAGAERHFHEAVAFEKDGDVENAIAEYKTAIKEYSDYAAAHYNLGRLYLDRKGYKDAIAEFKEMVRLKPNDADAHNNLGLALKHNGDLVRRCHRIPGGGAAQSEDGVGTEQSGQPALCSTRFRRRDSALSGGFGDRSEERSDAHEPG